MLGCVILLLLTSAVAVKGLAGATTIATPTPAQARYQDTDFIALIHFNMGTFGEKTVLN